jgi:hypothetical protein
MPTPTPTETNRYLIPDRHTSPLRALIEVIDGQVTIFPISQSDVDEEIIRAALRCLNYEAVQDFYSARYGRIVK